MVFLCLTFLILNFVIISCQQVNVNTSRGPLFGYHFDQGNDTSQLYYGQADVFLGIPYVLPPVGELRFKKPQPLVQYPGSSPYNATNYGFVCPQHRTGTTNDMMDEDCLYLNIYTPNAYATTKYPVMVNIHGGGLREGNNRLDIPGIVRNFLARGVVLVSIQYRVDLLGFFTTFTDDFPANLGLLDQVEALKFINQEISNFGGDPKRITIFGQSAGSMSVGAHTYSPLSQNLFQQAIQQSGATLTCFHGSLNQANLNFLYANKICNYTEAMWNSRNYKPLKDCMMALNFSHNMPLPNMFFGGTICWDYVQDNYFLPDVPRNLNKNRVNKPLMIGTCKDEWAGGEYRNLVTGQTNLSTYVKSYYEKYTSYEFQYYLGNQSKLAIGVWENAYLKYGSSTPDTDHLDWLLADGNTKSGAYFTAFTAKDVMNYLQNNNPNVYLYEFTWPSILNLECNLSFWQPATHGCESMLLFMPSGAWNSAVKNGQITQTDIKLANFLGEAWTNFAKFGKPTTTNTWKPVTRSEINATEYLEIGQNLTMKQGYREIDRKIFEQFMPGLVGLLPKENPDYNNGSNVNF